MKLPEHVEQAKADLKNTKNKDERARKQLSTLILLTETTEIAYEEYIEKMWKGLLRQEKILGNTQNNLWVYHFLDAVIIANEHKGYFSMNGETLKSNLEKINNLTKELIRTYQELGIDNLFMTYDPNVFPMFDDNDEIITDLNSLQSLGIVEALEYYKQYTNEEVGSFTQEGKITKRKKSNRFVRTLARRNETRYKKPLLGVTAHAAHFITETTYTESDIYSLVKGR